jgi:hypothetical protein
MSKITDKNEIEEYSDSEDDEQNESTFAGIEPTFKELVGTTKKQLYACIVRGPPITSKDAQNNTLLIIYVSKLNSLYQMCDELNTGKLSTARKEKKLSTFPLQTQESIKQLLGWLTLFFSKNKYVDTIPYSDYLEVQLRRYPCLQKIM